MVVKNDNIRGRREKRIKAIIDERMEDPEYVWKMKDNPWNQDSDNEQEHMDHRRRTPYTTKVRNQFIICVLVCSMIWVIFQLETTWALKGRQFIEKSLSEHFKFEAAASWYEDFFQGAPSFIPTFNKPDHAEKVNAQQYEHFRSPLTELPTGQITPIMDGLELNTANQAGIVSIDEGRVIYVGERDDTGMTIVIQHANQIQSIYGQMEESSLQVNHWVKKGGHLGTGSRLYFAIKQGDQFINPADVITFD